MNELFNPSPEEPSTLLGYRRSTLAIFSVICGIAGVLQILPVIGSITAIITGHMAKHEIRKSGGVVSGGGMATAGLLMGYITLAIDSCLLIGFAAVMIWGLVFNYRTNF